MQKLRLIINNLLTKNVECESSPETKIKVNTQQRTCHACALRYGFNVSIVFQNLRYVMLCFNFVSIFQILGTNNHRQAQIHKIG